MFFSSDIYNEFLKCLYILKNEKKSYILCRFENNITIYFKKKTVLFNTNHRIEKSIEVGIVHKNCVTVKNFVFIYYEKLLIFLYFNIIQSVKFRKLYYSWSSQCNNITITFYDIFQQRIT